MPQNLKFRQLPCRYAIVRLSPNACVPAGPRKAISSRSPAPPTNSIVCPLNSIWKEVAPGPRWICLKLEGPFPFSQTGVLLSSSSNRSQQTVFLYSPFQPTTRIMFWCRKISKMRRSGRCNLPVTSGHEVPKGQNEIYVTGSIRATRPANFAKHCAAA